MVQSVISKEEIKSEQESSLNVEQESKIVRSPIFLALDNYLRTLRNLEQASNQVLPHIVGILSEGSKACIKDFEAFFPEDIKDGEVFSVKIDGIHDLVQFESVLRRMEEIRSDRSISILAQSLFRQIFSEFDAFTGALLRGFYQKDNNLLKNISREVTVSELMEYQSMEELKNDILDKEIDCFRRESYVDQFRLLEKKFSIQKLTGFKEWEEFVELTQRRNICTHNAGLVNQQYLSVCKREGYKFDVEPAIGSSLEIDAKYLNRAVAVLSKISLMLTYTLWNKRFPDERDDIFSSLNEIIYKSLEQKRWAFVSALEDFVLSRELKSNVPDAILKVITVNIAIGHKFANKPQALATLIGALDWGGSGREFKLALAVLNGEFDNAAGIMKKIGREGEYLNEKGYHTWPLFNEFREHEQFYEVYKEIYGKNYSPDLTSVAPMNLPKIEIEVDKDKQGDKRKEKSKISVSKIKPPKNKKAINITGSAEPLNDKLELGSNKRARGGGSKA